MAQIIETEETLIIETPERIQLSFALASIGNRFLAVAIDHFLQITLLIFILGVSSLIIGNRGIDFSGDIFAGNEAAKWVYALLIFLIFFVWIGYFLLFEWFLNGQTPGKRWLKLRVIREDGRPITLWEALTRNLLRTFDFFPALYSIGLISIFLSNRDQRIGDLFAGTVVVRERTEDAPSFSEAFSGELQDAAFVRIQIHTDFKANIAEIDPLEIEVVETFLRRRVDLNEQQRIWMAWRIALPIMYKIKPVYDLQSFTYEGFLEELFHQYHARRRLIN